MHGRFTWYELYTTDVAAAKRYYPAITGWGVERWGESESDDPYEMWTAGGVPFAGLMALTPDMKATGAPPHWLSYVEVTSADETIKKAIGMGAKVAAGPETVPTVGVLAVLTDPQDAVFAILQSENPSQGFDGTASLGKPSWHELMTTDYKAAFAFYSALFGWTKISEADVGGGMTYMEFGAHSGTKAVGGMFNRGGPMANVPPNWLVYTNVRDAKGSVGAITRGGGTVINGPMEVPGGTWITAFTDPQGVAHAVHSVPEKAAAAAKPAKAKATAKKPSKAKPKSKKKDKKKDKKAKRKARKEKKKAKKAARKAKKKR